MSSGRKRSLSGPCTVTPTKKKKYVCKYQPSWEKELEWLQKCNLGEDWAYCKLCKVNFSVASGALYDVKRHATRINHVKAEQASKTSKSMDSFVENKKLSKVILAETLFSNFIAEHNLAFSLADHFTKLVPKMFPDSQIASEFACGRTKCTQIVKRAIAPAIESTVVELCKNHHFSVLCDESTDRGSDKCFVILVRAYKESSKEVRTFFLDMPVVNQGNAENLLNAMDNCFR